MKKIKLALAKKTPSQTAEFADGLVEALTGNANVPTPDPALTVLTDGAQEIRDKNTEIAATETLLSTQQSELGTFTATLKLNIRMLADHVEDKCNGDATKLQSTGFDIVGSPQPLGELPQVQNLRIEASSVEGHLRARWKRVAGARNYVLDQAANPEGPWALGVATTTRTSHTFTGLTPGAKYWFRARAFGTSGFGGWSDPACKIAA